jgi:hypothetical protein
VVACAEGPNLGATVLPELDSTAPLLLFAQIARLALGHAGALLSEALHHGGQERPSPDGHDRISRTMNETRSLYDFLSPYAADAFELTLNCPHPAAQLRCDFFVRESLHLQEGDLAQHFFT